MWMLVNFWFVYCLFCVEFVLERIWGCVLFGLVF